MKKALFKVLSSLTSAALIGSALIVPASAEVALKENAENGESIYFVNPTPEECVEYKIYDNYFGVNPDEPIDTGSSMEFFRSPSLRTCIDYNIYPNKYNVIPPTHVTNRLIEGNNDYYKYRSSTNTTFEVEPGVFPDQRGVCYSVMRKSGDEILYLHLPLDAADIKAAEAYIEADDRAGLYDFIVEKNKYQHPAHGEVNPVADIINRDFTWAEGYNLYPDYTTDQIYQWVIDRYVYPSFQPNITAASAGVSDSAVITDRLDGDSFNRAAEFIESGDREGLYDFLYTANEALSKDDYFIWCTTRFTGSYAIDDESYNLVLKDYVLPGVKLYKEAASEAEAPLMGDVNMDGKVSILDIIMMNKISAGTVDLRDYSHAHVTDVDGSYVIDNNDITVIMEYLVDLIDEFPAEK